MEVHQGDLPGKKAGGGSQVEEVAGVGTRAQASSPGRAEAAQGVTGEGGRGCLGQGLGGGEAGDGVGGQRRPWGTTASVSGGG